MTSALEHIQSQIYILTKESKRVRKAGDAGMADRCDTIVRGLKKITVIAEAHQATERKLEKLSAPES